MKRHLIAATRSNLMKIVLYSSVNQDPAKMDLIKQFSKIEIYIIDCPD